MAEKLLDRITVLADRTIPALQVQVERAMAVATNDARRRRGGVALPDALVRKYPNARFEPGWQWVFPSRQVSRVPQTGEVRRYHLFNSSVQRAVKVAGQWGRAVRWMGCEGSARYHHGPCLKSRPRSQSRDRAPAPPRRNRAAAGW